MREWAAVDALIGRWEVWRADVIHSRRRRQVDTWRWFDRLIELTYAHEQSRADPLKALWSRCEEGLPEFLLPDPAREPWATFRPLRLSREEDWSDWLAHLILTSPDGALHRALFGTEIGDLVRVHREIEVAFEGTARVDLLVEGADGTLHVEVKVGDPHLGKTWPTALALRQGDIQANLGSPVVGDWLLLQEASWIHEGQPYRDRWDTKYGITVDVLTWRQVGIVLRRLIRQADKVGTWLVLARAFVGAIEQTLLRHPYEDAGTGRVRAGDFDAARRYLEEVLDG